MELFEKSIGVGTMSVVNQAIKDLWVLENYCDKTTICEAGKLLYYWLRNKRNNIIAQCLIGERVLPEKLGSLKELEQEITHHFSPLSESIEFSRALAVVVDQGNITGVFDVCPPRIPLYVPPEVSPFQKKKIYHYSKVGQWRKCVINPASGKILNQQQTIGRIIASAALNGGLMSSSCLAALYLKLSEPLEAIGQESDLSSNPQHSLVFYDLGITTETSRVTRLRRWFPDNFTEFLILAYSGNSPQTTYSSTSNKKLHKKIFRCIKEYFVVAGLESGQIPTSLGSFIEYIQTEAWLYLPGYLCDFAASKLTPHSPKNYAWKRMFKLMKAFGGGEDDIVASETKAFAKQFNASMPEGTDKESDNIFNAAEMKELNKILNCTDRTLVRKNLKKQKDKFIGESFALEAVIIGWTEFMVKEGSYSGNELYLSTIRNYVSQTSGRIAGYAGEEDVTLLEGEGLEEIYRQILSDVESESYRQYIARGLREFHFYLVEKFHLAPINYSEVLGLISPDRIVDANLISFDEYHNILDEIERQRQELSLFHEDFPDIIRLIFILAFRCGLRRSEVLKLRINDLHAMAPAVLLIRPNYARLLKTKSSVRQLPVSSLLAKDELAELIHFQDKRQWQEKTAPFSEFLFAIPDNMQMIAPEVKIFSIIVNIMRRVTGDPNPKFQHLRHSFASWTVLRLMLPDLRLDDRIKLPFLPVTSTYLNESRLFRTKLLNKDHPSRKNLRAVASLLGHSGPESSVPHYIHLNDLLLKWTLDKRLSCNDRLAFFRATSVHRTTCHRWYKKGGMNGLINNLRRKVSGKRLLINSKTIAPSAIDDDPEKSYPFEVRFIYNVWKYLVLSSRDDADKEELRQLLDIPKEKLLIIERTVEKLKRLQPISKRGTPIRWFYAVFDKRSPEKITETNAVEKPNSKADRKIIAKYTPLVWKLFEQQELLTQTALKLYVQNIWYSKHDIICRGFKDTDLARDYFSFLLAMGLKKTEIHFVSYDENKRSKIRSEWRRLLKLIKRDNKIQKVERKNKKTEVGREWLGIRPKSGAAAFRFLMVMSFICLDFPGKFDKLKDRAP